MYVQAVSVAVFLWQVTLFLTLNKEQKQVQLLIA
jgi:hypothetical protein